MRDESRGRTGTLVVAIAVVTGLLAMAGPTDGASKQVTFNCPMETTKTARLSSSDGGVEVLVGDECICGTSESNLDMGVEISGMSLIRKMVGARQECPACGEDIRPDARFCDSCGEKINTYGPTRSGHLKCWNCEEQFKPGKNGLVEGECQSCGEDLDHYMHILWDRKVENSSQVRVSGSDIPAEGRSSTVKLYCHDKTAVFAYWEKLLVAELSR